MNPPQMTPEQVATCTQAVQRLEQIMHVMDDLQECGEDCTLRRQRAAVEMQGLQKLLAKFGSGQ